MRFAARDFVAAHYRVECLGFEIWTIAMGMNSIQAACAQAFVAVLLCSPCIAASAIQPSDIGHQIFFDVQFSTDHSTSCSSCHAPDHAFSTVDPLAIGHNHLRGTRNAPSLLNATHYRLLFWDGRSPSLEDQVLRPFVNEREFGMRSQVEVLEKIRSSAQYVAEFREAFGTEGESIQISQVASVLAAYVRSLGGRYSRLDCFLAGNHQEVLTPTERQGLEVFRGPGGCDTCHVIEGKPASLTDNKFHVSGVGADRFSSSLPELSRKLAGLDSYSRENLIFKDPVVAAAGRFVVTTDPKDIGAFRTPSLRNVALTAPYMHDGSFETLEEVIDYELYYTGSRRGTPIIITPAQKTALLAFLDSLNDSVVNEQACQSVLPKPSASVNGS